ncbi:hypothetical protein [Myroides marinus]|uniref:plasmid mobilization protein n=1 Tax=Myroides marinus TaxID=703342 RepID=UPI002576117E|nr:hypothetical protein [Myroides marinus]MDM1362607.1 hypothetical protein [Myroides marinus]
MEKSTNKTGKNKKETVWHRHSFALTDQQQQEFDRLLLKYNINNKTSFIASLILSESIKVVVIDQVSFEYHASLSNLINYFKALGVSYNVLVNRTDLPVDSQEILKDISDTTIELSKVCQEIIKLTIAFESTVLQTTRDYGS